MKKDSNPKKAFGDMKVGLSSVPMGPIFALAVAMAEGGRKYGKHNYRYLGCKHSTYFDAAVGHLVSWWEGEDIDEESGVHHLIKALASIVVMYDSILCGNDNDDRPIRYPKPVPLRINDVIKALNKKYPNPPEPFTQKRMDEQAQDRTDQGLQIWAKNETDGIIQSGTPVFYQSDIPTPKEIDRVLDCLYAKAGPNTNVLFITKKDADDNPGLLRTVEEAVESFLRAKDSDPTETPPGYGGRPRKETEAQNDPSTMAASMQSLLNNIVEHDAQPKKENGMRLPKIQIGAYFSHPIRGLKGAAATVDDQSLNNNLAIVVGKILSNFCPALDLYIPAEHDEFGTEFSLRKSTSVEEILEIDKIILERRDILIAFCYNGVLSSGMKIEIDHANDKGIPVFMFEKVTEIPELVKRIINWYYESQSI